MRTKYDVLKEIIDNYIENIDKLERRQRAIIAESISVNNDVQKNYVDMCQAVHIHHLASEGILGVKHAGSLDEAIQENKISEKCSSRCF